MMKQGYRHIKSVSIQLVGVLIAILVVVGIYLASSIETKSDIPAISDISIREEVGTTQTHSFETFDDKAVEELIIAIEKSNKEIVDLRVRGLIGQSTGIKVTVTTRQK